MIDPYEYSITIKKVTLDGEKVFEATIAELPDVFEYGQSYKEAYELAIDTITTAAAAKPAYRNLWFNCHLCSLSLV